LSSFGKTSSLDHNLSPKRPPFSAVIVQQKIEDMIILSKIFIKIMKFKEVVKKMDL
jgi:hypothetical protein